MLKSYKVLNIFEKSLYSSILCLLPEECILNKEVKIVDVVGKTVVSTIANSNNYAIDISSLNKGLYFILIDNSKHTYKFIKE